MRPTPPASKDILKLQCVQNGLVMVVTRSTRFSHSVPLLKSLHWLPVQSPIIFKLCTIDYQIPFLPKNLRIYFPCFLYHPSPENSVHLVFPSCLFPGLKLIMELVCFFGCCPYSFRIHSLNMLCHQIA